MPNLPGIPGEADEQQTRVPLRAWVELLVTAVSAAILAFIAFGFVIEATASHHDPRGGSRGGEVAGAVVCGLLAIVCARWAVRAEHRVRGLEPPPKPERPRLSLRADRSHRHYGPGGAAWGVTIFTAMTAVMIGLAISNHSQAVRSSYVQRHGILTAGTVTSVFQHEHCGRGGCTHTADIFVALANQAAGDSRADVHYPAYSYLDQGMTVSVLVDPKERAYAELPGHPFKTAVNWVLALVFAAFFGVFDVVMVRNLLHLRARTGLVPRPLGATTA
jgi:hypothetical protein